MPVPGFTSLLPPNDDAAFTLVYFPLLAKGLGPALVAEFSGTGARVVVFVVCAHALGGNMLKYGVMQ